MGIVYYGNYLTWFEVARGELLRQFGADYRAIEHDRIYLPVIEAHCRYLSPARYDDLIEIRTEVTRPSRLQVRFEYELSRVDNESAVASGSTIHVAVNENGRPCRLPARLAELFE